MDLKAILNPVDKSQVLDEVADDEICQAVQDSRNVQKEAIMDPDFNDDSSANAFPMHCEVLQAVSVINNYVDTLDSASACKLEAVLASFKHQMHLEESRNMKSTHITDYFT